MELYKINQYPDKGQRSAYSSEAYGVMSWWDCGHLMETIGHRIPNANPFQQSIGNLTAGLPDSSPFLAQNESEAKNVLANLDKNRSLYKNTKYVMIDWDMDTGKFYAMTAWSNIPITKYYGFFYQPQGNQLVPAGVLRDPFFETMASRLFYFDGIFVKTFEHVPGAVIKGKAVPGTEVTIAVPITTNKNRGFVNRQSNTTDSKGEFTLVVPYIRQKARPSMVLLRYGSDRPLPAFSR
jgi:asparagine N-glycosylation enzyme membrane subunit Stt3